MSALRQCDVRVAESPAEIGAVAAQALGVRTGTTAATV